VNEKGTKIKKLHDLLEINQFFAPKALNTRLFLIILNNKKNYE